MPPSDSAMRRSGNFFHIGAQIQSAAELAMEIGMDEMVGLSWKLDAEMLERIRAVSAAEVQAVAKKYFRPETLTVAQLDPLPMDPQARAKAAAAPAAHRH